MGVILGMIGLVNILTRPTLLGVFQGGYFLFLGAALSVVTSAFHGSTSAKSHSVAIFILLSAVVFLSLGCAASIRAFYLRRNISMDEIRKLKN